MRKVCGLLFGLFFAVASLYLSVATAHVGGESITVDFYDSIGSQQVTQVLTLERYDFSYALPVDQTIASEWYGSVEYHSENTGVEGLALSAIVNPHKARDALSTSDTFS